MEKEILHILDLIKKQNLEKAFVEAKKVFTKNKHNKKIMNILAYLLIQKNRFDEAISIQEEYYQKNNDEKDFDFYVNMGVSLKSIEDYKNSLDMFSKAQEINTESPLAFMTPAEVKVKLREFNEALVLINKALEKIKSSKNINHLQLTHAIRVKSEILIALNKSQENFDFLKKELDQKFTPEIFFFLVQSNTKLINSGLIKTAEEMLSLNEMKFNSKLDRFWFVHPIYFALAKYYEDKDKKKSEDYYVKGNTEVTKSLRFNSYDYQKKIVKITEHFNQSFDKLISHDPNIGNKNIFILGSPRSGTTLIESIIGSSHDVMSGGELLSASRLIEQNLLSSDSSKLALQIREFQNKYLSRTDFIRSNKNFIIDKLPDNFTYIGYLKKLLPNSKIIRTFRNPWDVATSLYKQRYVANIPYSSSFFNIGVFFANFEAINKFWDQKLDPKDIFTIRYEELVVDPEMWQKNIYQFLGIDGDYNEEARQNFFSATASMHQISSPVHQKSVKKDDFISYKSEFYEAFDMQRKYWEMQGISNSDDLFFGYKLD